MWRAMPLRVLWGLLARKLANVLVVRVGCVRWRILRKAEAYARMSSRIYMSGRHAGNVMLACFRSHL